MATINPKFIKINDRRGQPVLGLWKRGEKFYFQTQLPGEKSPRRIPLKTEKSVPVADLKEAQAAIQAFRTNLAAGTFVSKKSPTFSTYADHYLVWNKTMGLKTARTLSTEKAALNGWKEFLHETPLDRITKAHLNEYAAERKAEGLSPRTINVDMNVLGFVLRLAKEEEKLARVVTDEWTRLPYQAPKRDLVSFADVEKLCSEALRKNENGKDIYESGQALADYIKLMTFCGARRDSALAVRWDDVHWDRKQLWLRKAKFSKTNLYVDMTADLEQHLRDMQSRALKDCPFLFPSPVNPKKALTTLTNTFEKVRAAAGLPGIHFHDFRHLFASSCVMDGVDWMTIARWLGHNDGGVLLGKIYGHISNEHGQRSAAKVSLSGRRNGDHPALELVDSGPRDVKAPTHTDQVEPASLAPAVDSGSADANAGCPRS